MKIDILQFTSPYTAYFIDGETETRPNGKNYMVYKDKAGKTRELIVNDDVEPMIFTYPGRIPGMKDKQIATYLLARDNFLSYRETRTETPVKDLTAEEGIKALSEPDYVILNTGAFAVTGIITNEQITQVADWGMIEALVRATKSMDAMTAFKGIIVKLVALGVILVIAYMVMQWIQGGGITLPF